MLSFGLAFVDGGFRPVICKQGPKWTQVVYIDSTRVRVRKERGTVPCRPLKASVTLKELARKMSCRTNCLGLTMQISKGAKQILNEARR